VDKPWPTLPDSGRGIRVPVSQDPRTQQQVRLIIALRDHGPQGLVAQALQEVHREQQA
jgi:hypothetical protein